MTLDTMPPRRPASRPESVADRRAPGTQRGPGRNRDERQGLPSRSLMVALVLACLTLMVVDHTSGDRSPVAPVRRVAGEVIGPAEAFVAGVMRPLVSLPDAFRSNADLREQNKDLEAENADLLAALRAEGYDANRITEMRNLRALAGDLGYALMPTRVIAIGPAQSFSQTVTIDAGSDAGLRPDLTVLNGDGLVGRVTSVTSHTATVRLVVDSDITVGGRLGENMELGFVHGRGGIGDDARLDLELVDETAVPHQGQAVVTWGSKDGAPFVSGVPIGEVTRVFESLREGSYRAVVRPYVDFSALDLVGVVVPSGTSSTRPLLEADRSVEMP